MLTHLSDLITQPVDELHVLAPFFDREAVALAELVRVTNPADVHLYIGGGVSVEGVRLLEAVTREDRQVHIHGFRPSDFVHAKLVGIVRGDWGLLLGGSANISRAGLFGTVAGGTGNAEAGVLVELAPERLRELFVPEQLEIHDLDLTFLRGLVYRRPPDSPVLPLLLRSATRLDDGRIAVDFDGEAECVLYLVGEAITCPVNGKETAQPVDQSERGLLVHLADSTGTRLSNWVPVDNPRRLESWLQTRTPQTTDTPAGLEPGDLDTPVGRLLRRLNEACIFDIDQTPAAARARSAAEETDDPNFWERLLQEELRVDPRTVSYSRRGEHAGRAELDGDFFALMRLMLDRAPTRQAPHLVRGGVEQPETHHEGQRWSPSRRLQVRLFNVLERWCSALADPRLRWLAPAAPVRNYSRLLAALVECWACDYLPRERLVRLSRVLFTSFIRGDRTLGFLCALKEEERAEALATLSEADRALAAILAYSVLHFSWHDKSGSREEIFVWQSLLDPALTYGVIGVDEQTVAMLAEQIGQVIPSRDIQEFLLWAATYTDDRHWEQSVRLMLDLPKLELTADNVHPEFEVTLKVEGVGDPLSDPRLLTLVDLALQYRKAKGAVLTLPGCRLSAHLDDHVYAVLGGVMYESQKVLTRQLLESLRASAAGWGAILEAESGLGHVVA